MRFGGEFGGSRAARADSTHAWVWDHRFEQLPRMKRDLAAHTTALETADAAKWVNRQKYCSTQLRATISMSIPTGSYWRPAAEAAERRRGPLPHWKRQTRRVDNSGFLSHSGWVLSCHPRYCQRTDKL